jgi:hypothetical protein
VFSWNQKNEKGPENIELFFNSQRPEMIKVADVFVGYALVNIGGVSNEPRKNFSGLWIVNVEKEKDE